MSQNLIKIFETYAEAFELGFASRDWQVVDDLLADDVTWSLEGLPAPTGGTQVGRKAVIAKIRKSIDGFDRRFDLRKPEMTSPLTAIPSGIYMLWQVTYTRHGLPPFVLRGEEWDLFCDGKMTMHYERFHNAGEMQTYLRHHADALLPV